MCGIAGIFGCSPDMDIGQYGSGLTQALRHRGPDDSGAVVDLANRCLLAHCRLSIIDPTPGGHQPMSDQSGRYTIVYNGEIYNFREIRAELENLGRSFVSRTDTEVVLNAYIEWGQLCLNRLRGMFAFAVLDRRGSRGGPALFLARDRFGIKPLIYSRRPDCFVFGSELKALIRAGLIERRISFKALGQYCRTGSVLQPDTIYENVFQLEPGCYMFVSQGGDIAPHRWYDVRNEALRLSEPYAGKSYQDLVDLTRTKLDEATRYHTIADVEVGAFLSGGIDSSSVVALMKKHLKNRIRTFSIGFERQKEVADESSAAGACAGYIGTEHHGIVLRDSDIPGEFDRYIGMLDQPSTDGFNTLLVSGAAAPYVKVALSGLGGDELFAGYTYFRDIATFSKVRLPFKGLISGREDRMPLRLAKIFSYYGLTPYQAVRDFRQYHSAQWLNCSLNIKDDAEPVNERDEAGLGDFSRMGLSELQGYLCSTLLRDCDVMSMAHSLEVRPVLLDHKLVEHALALPDWAKVRGNRMKPVLADAAGELIPRNCRLGEKNGFELPFYHWMRGVLQKKMKDIFAGRNASVLFRPEFRGLIENGKVNRRHWQWFVLLAWLEQNKVDLENVE